MEHELLPDDSNVLIATVFVMGDAMQSSPATPLPTAVLAPVVSWHQPDRL